MDGMTVVNDAKAVRPLWFGAEVMSKRVVTKSIEMFIV